MVPPRPTTAQGPTREMRLKPSRQQTRTPLPPFSTGVREQARGVRAVRRRGRVPPSRGGPLGAQPEGQRGRHRELPLRGRAAGAHEQDRAGRDIRLPPRVGRAGGQEALLRRTRFGEGQGRDEEGVRTCS